MIHDFDPNETIKIKKTQVIQCKTCGFRHVYPYPKKSDYAKFYFNEYQIPKFHTPMDQFKIDNLIEKIEKIIEIYNIKEEKSHDISVLDVGCGFGEFLDLAKQRGWQTLGIEPSESMRNIAIDKGLEIKPDLYMDMDHKILGEFDIVNLSFIIEHINDPIPFLETVIKYQLKPNGIMIVEVPNDFNPFQIAATSQLKLPSWWVCIPDHQNYFNHQTLSTLLLKLGLDICYHTTKFPIDLFLLFGDNYVADPQLGAECHKRRVNFEKHLNNAGFKELKQQFYESLRLLGLGREVICYARKRE